MFYNMILKHKSRPYLPTSAPKPRGWDIKDLGWDIKKEDAPENLAHLLIIIVALSRIIIELPGAGHRADSPP